MSRVSRLKPSALVEWPRPFDPRWELDWSRRDYGRRLLREHLDQSNDSSSRRSRLIDQHVRRLRMLLPSPPARVLDAACGPGLYALRLAASGYDVSGIDVNAAAIRYARAETRERRTRGAVRFEHTDLRELEPPSTFYDAAILIYYVLEAFPAREQPRVLRRIASTLRPGGRIVVEMRFRPDQLPGRLSWWNVVPHSLLGDRRHLLVADSTYEPRRNTYV
ncbi:MAG: class I SAM-dependent methyltransferase, partial [Candidatus Dormibacteria bacterium]